MHLKTMRTRIGPDCAAIYGLPIDPTGKITSPLLAIQSSHGSSNIQRKIAIAIDLSDESGYAVRWAAEQYLLPKDLVFLLHVQHTSVYYGADWGVIYLPQKNSSGDEVHSPNTERRLEEEFDDMTTTKVAELAQPLVDANISFTIHILKDRDMRERICLEVERLGLNAIIMGSRGFGSRRMINGKYGSVSDYCIRHSACPVLVVKIPEDSDDEESTSESMESITIGDVTELEPVLEDEQEYQDADGEVKEVVHVEGAEKTAK